MNPTAFVVVASLIAAFSATAEKPLADYGFIRGVCHGMGQGDEEAMRVPALSATLIVLPLN